MTLTLDMTYGCSTRSGAWFPVVMGSALVCHTVPDECVHVPCTLRLTSVFLKGIVVCVGMFAGTAAARGAVVETPMYPCVHE
jgi:hypothetical protein